VSELITVSNGEQKLRILDIHEAEHARLGWHRIEDEPEDSTDEEEQKPARKTAARAAK